MSADVSRVIRLYKTFTLFNGLLWWLPIFYLYQRDVGLSPDEIFGIQSIYYTAFLVLDIPTSMLADRFDYRRFLVAGAMILLAANLAPVAWPSYGGFLTHFLLIALSYSLTSGASSAYLYEYLHRSGAVEAYQQAEGGARARNLVGRIVCLPAAGVLMQWHMPTPYLLTAAGAGFAAMVALRLPALPGHALPHEMPEAQKWGSLGRSWTLLRRSRMLILLMVQGVAIFTLARILQGNLFQPILESKRLPLAGFGVLMAVTTVFEALGAAKSRWLRRYLGDVRAVFLLTLIMAGCLALVVPAGLVAVGACLCVFSLAAGLSFPIQRQLINNAITDPRCRATLLSIESLIDRAVCALVILVLGGYLSAGEMNAFLFAAAGSTAALMAVLVMLIYFTKQRRAVRVSKTPS